MPAVGSVRDLDVGHADLWPRVVRRVPRLAGTPYERTPRGRVLRVDADGRFRLLMSPGLAAEPAFAAAVARRLGVSTALAHVVADEHYGDPGAADLDD